MATKNKSSSYSYSSSTSSMLPDWSLLPEELLQIVTKNVENCFDVVHARVQSSATFASPFEYFLGGIGRDEYEDRRKLQCSVKVEIRGYDPALMNLVDCQILSLGHQYRLIAWEPKDYRGVAFLPLNNKGREGEFVVILNYTYVLMVLTSAEMKWKRLENKYFHYRSLFAGGNSLDALASQATKLPDFSRFTCIVSRLDEKGGKWVEVTDLGNRVFFIGYFGNVSCSAKELPDGCGLSGNSILFTNEPTFAYKYGLHTRSADDDLNCWRATRENRVMILNTSPVLAIQVER
ncbi:unnamed protein product [Arabidopsis thaliana]|uniref:KIB1-4 beta-propeller domain-containing protein n=1 Tax=Arabidopsis thaliana TaxID=3702 RepID=A0A5S9WXZ9_ARATH|nr:unnamed protein product [Arabidopsis thaliana]